MTLQSWPGLLSQLIRYWTQNYRTFGNFLIIRDKWYIFLLIPGHSRINEVLSDKQQIKRNHCRYLNVWRIRTAFINTNSVVRTVILCILCILCIPTEEICFIRLEYYCICFVKIIHPPENIQESDAIRKYYSIIFNTIVS